MAITNAGVHPTPSLGKPPIAALGISLDISKQTGVTGLAMDTFHGNGPIKQTLFTLTAMPMTITDALAYASQKLGTFPEGRIHVLDCITSLAMTTTSTIASTLNAAAVVSHGIGSAPASSITLATTMMNMMPGSGEAVNNITASSTINVASATVTGKLAAVSAAHLGAILDGTGTAVPIYLNLGIPTNTEIDADATVTITGTILITWMCTGDV